MEYYNFTKKKCVIDTIQQLIAQIAGYKCWHDLEETQGPERELSIIITRYCNNANTLKEWNVYSTEDEKYTTSSIEQKIELASVFFNKPMIEVEVKSAFSTFNQVGLFWTVQPNDLESVSIQSVLGNAIVPINKTSVTFDRNYAGPVQFLLQTIDKKGNKSKGIRYQIYLNPLPKLN